MEQIDPGSSTPATEIAFDRIKEEIARPSPRYPNSTVLVPADVPGFELLVARAATEGKPVAVIFADGREVLATPEVAGIAALTVTFLRALWSQMRHRGVSVGPSTDDASSVTFPPNFRVEIRERVPA